MRTIILILVLLSIAVAYSATIIVTEISEIGGTDAVKVSKYNIRVISISIEVSGDVYNNRITSITVSVASSHPGYYNVQATVISRQCTDATSWTNIYLDSTPRSLTSSLSNQCRYTPPGATVEVRGVPA